MNSVVDNHWIGTWSTTPDAVAGAKLSDQTIRMIARVSVGGTRVRIRISNAYGHGDLKIGAAHVGLGSGGASIFPDSGRPAVFNGSMSVTVPAGAYVISDPIDLEVPALADLAISVYLPDDLPEDFQVTGHDNCHQTNYVSPRGNFVSAPVLPIENATDTFLFVAGVEVESLPDAGTVVAFGDSLTEGNISTLDANQRWPDQLARRLVAHRDGRIFGVVNQGIGGNRLLHDGRGDNGLRRFDRDVLAQSGVTHVVILLGVNDLRNSQGNAKEIVSAEALIVGLDQLAQRARACGIKVIGGTILPFENDKFKGGFYTVEGDAKRRKVNDWIRQGGAFDAVIDFDAALRDPGHQSRLNPIFDSGDHLHPSDFGYQHMADTIDLSIFD